jgi:hypothetical protein
VTVDFNNSRLGITFEYYRELKPFYFELVVNFRYLNSNLNIFNFAATPAVAYSSQFDKINFWLTNSLIGRFYTNDQYAQAKILYRLSTAIGIWSFLAFFIGIFTKEVVGLETALLCQFTYLSLFFFKDTLELPFFALKGLIYSTGYNLPLADMNF